MMKPITIEDYQQARKRRLAAEEWDSKVGSDARQLLRLAVGLGLFFTAWLARGLGAW